MLRSVKEGEISEATALKRLEPCRRWVWTAIDPVSKVLLAIEVGPRTVERAHRVVHQVARRLVLRFRISVLVLGLDLLLKWEAC